MNHTDILNRLVSCFSYSTYLEIGVANGLNFNSVNVPRENKVGVDPQPASLEIHKMSSDEFFLTNKKTFDLIFIDGLHHANQVYQDIINALNVLNDNGTILCHDISPKTIEQQTVPRIQKCWTGDCWKAWVKLRAERSDLTMEVVDTDYGCGIIRRGQQKPIELPSLLTWQALVLNRQLLLNLIEPSEFTTSRLLKNHSFCRHASSGAPTLRF